MSTLRDIIPIIFQDPREDPNNVVRPYVDAFVDFDRDVVQPEIDNFSDVANIDKTRIIDLLLQNIGNPFRFPDLTEDDKRALARSLVAMYRLKGTREGILQAILFFTGEQARIEDSTDTDLLWQLGVDELGVGTFLAAGPTTQSLFTFVVLFDDCVFSSGPTPVSEFPDQELVDSLNAIVTFMKPGWTTHFLRDCDKYGFPFTETFGGPEWAL